MVFSSLLFLFGFLCLQLICYFLVGKRFQNGVLLVFSLIFYAWCGPKYLLLLMTATGVSWLCAWLIDEDQSAGGTGRRWLILDCVLLLSILAVFKYTGFFLENIQAVWGIPERIPEIVLPLGISFYTFQLLSYTIDVYRKTATVQKKYWKLLLYAGLFHQCVAGPIVRYQTIAGEIEHRRITTEDLAEGIRRFSVGLAKKAILANGCAQAADMILPVASAAVSGSSAAGLWIGMFFYMLQIYLDFSAYSDMAIGMGRMVGFHYLENFNYPYLAKSVRDFWRRWHISLSTFFRDYVYIPMGGSRVRIWKWIRNMITVWFLTGLWHGASWNYILWGLYFCIFLLAERLLRKIHWPRLLKHLYALIVIFFGWVLFRFENLELLWSVLKGMFGIGTSALWNTETLILLQNHLFFLIAAVIACTPLGHWIRSRVYLRAGIQKRSSYLMQWTDLVTPVLLLFFSACALVGNSYNPFLYFQF